MSEKNKWRSLPPDNCPYCGEGDIYRLADHLPCDAVPSTEEVIDA